MIHIILIHIFTIRTLDDGLVFIRQGIRIHHLKHKTCYDSNEYTTHENINP
ncbi:hypothetical protein HanRHA438_Chr06g0247981 [Helianthus annuus]|nr:hypothetical protein HanIR_Chr17g0880931 [Helianthus annuus]KAJ0564881.1 hypothetical protein HanIR_Chr06g0256521 [Helianthus annuus]KAJ0612729.1 hypothetical protein HanHA300_Chr01g0030651 [Helianthus annuus]KAJ0628097.1 hypothetical protein HanHA89_Chr01g0033021 [Helianthus annuus]KAJ0636851.1 hypothetical protein HanOQP8_Chr17g0666841 [Helianthus annuus]